MAITLYPNMQRTTLFEDASTDSLRNSSENYTGIVFDTKNNKFNIVTGKFRDKKDMYEKMTKQDKYLRRAYESRIFDWIEKNAQTPVDGYLMLSTAVSKWKNNNVLSKYYKKLLHDLPYINREGRKGDPQTMGIEANFESIEDNYEDMLIEDNGTTVNFADIEQGLHKNLNFDDAGDYRIIISGLDFIGAPVYDSGIIGSIDKENNVYDKNGNEVGKLYKLQKAFAVVDDNNNTILTLDTQGNVYDKQGNVVGKRQRGLIYDNNPEKDIIGYVSDEFVKDEKSSQKPNKEGGIDTFTKYVYLVKDNDGDTIGYYQKMNNKVYNKLEGGKVIGTVDNDNLEPSNHKVEITGRLDNYKIDANNILKNPMFVIKTLQAIYNDPELRNQHGTYDITLRDRKDNKVNEFRLNLNQLNSALIMTNQLAKGTKVDTDFDKKNIEIDAMSPEEKAAREREQLDWSQGQKSVTFSTNYDDKQNRTWDVSAGADLDRDALDDMIDKNKVSGQVADDMINKAERNNINKLNRAKKANEKIINDYLAKENAWKEKRDWVKANGGTRERLIQIAKEYQPSPDEIKKYTDAKAELENINRELKYANNVEESIIAPMYVNDGADSAQAYANALATDAGVFQETSTHSELNQVLFDGKILRSDVRKALLDIAEAFKNDLKISYEPVDIYFTGSEANYNYNENSDIDVHLVYDFENVGPVAQTINQYLQTAKKVFNNNHEITVKGLPVEVGAEMKDTPLVTSGVYSLLNDSWVIEPENANKDIAEPTEPYYNEIKLRLEDAITSKDYEKIKDAVEFIWGIRKEGLANEGEFGPSNTLFKKLRNEGILSALKQAYYDAESSDLSLESMMKEAGFNDKEEVDKNLPEDLFDKSENEIIDGLMDHYEGNESEAIAKVEDTLKNIDDGYKDKLHNVIKKIKESSSFGNKCRKIVEKILREDENKSYGEIIKDTAEKIASKFLKDNDGDTKAAEQAIDKAKDLLDDIEIDDNDRQQIENAGIKAKIALAQYAKNQIAAIPTNDKMADDIIFGKSQYRFVPSLDARNRMKKERELPSNFIGKDFVNFFKDEAEVSRYLLGIRKQIPLSIFDRPYAFYIVDDEGKRIALRGIENTIYPEEVWVEELETKPTAPTDAIIAHYNGYDVQDLSDKVIGYAKDNKAYTKDDKFLGMIDQFGNVFDPAKTELRNSAIRGYAMPLGKYIELLHSDANKETLAKAIKADPLSQKVGDDVATQFGYLQGKANEVKTAKQRWILQHMDDLQLDHYPAGVRDAIYIRIAKEHEPTDEVMSDYKTAYSKEPLMKVTPEIKAMYNQEESLEEDVLTEDADYYTVNNDYRVMKNKLQDMDIPILFMKGTIKALPKDKYGEAPKFVKLQGVLKNPNENLKIVPFDNNDEELKNAGINADNYIISYDDEGRAKIIGYAPQQKLSNYIANGHHLDPRVAFKFTDDTRENMIPAGQVLGDDKVQMFKITAVDPETGARLTKKMGHTPEQPITKAEMFDLLSRASNTLAELTADIDTRADINADKSRDVINKNDKQSEWVDLNDNEIMQVLALMVQREGEDSKYSKIYKDFVDTKEPSKDVAKALRAYDPDFAQSIAYRNGAIKIHLPYLDTDQKPHQYKKSPLDKLLGK